MNRSPPAPEPAANADAPGKSIAAGKSNTPGNTHTPGRARTRADYPRFSAAAICLR
ncbi:hypothetical protein [Streptomyces sp. TUS-ST3]|uniref:hypothetical protein n=1 Tax=Streptomyces sp. TUS-ST3 TaxID=3025591 RepID=UPI0024E17C55|nr:hypothetical protein [Streptomyces sp. TUS-ST3]